MKNKQKNTMKKLTKKKEYPQPTCYGLDFSHNHFKYNEFVLEFCAIMLFYHSRCFQDGKIPII
jgi:hypothetical protein